MKRNVLFDCPGNNYSKETGVGQSELRISIRGGGIGVLFCNLASQPAVLPTGRGERYCHW